MFRFLSQPSVEVGLGHCCLRMQFVWALLYVEVVVVLVVVAVLVF